MGSIASINFKKSGKNADGCFRHNTRQYSPPYLIDDDASRNFYSNTYKQARDGWDNFLETAKTNYKKRTNQPFKAKHTIVEAVMNIKAETTNAQVMRTASAVAVKMGMEILQVAVHRDEGFVDVLGKKNTITTLTLSFQI